MIVTVSNNVTTDEQGRSGVAVRVEFRTFEDGVSGVYHFVTHGMTAAEIAAERDRIAAHHAAKVARVPSLHAMTLGLRIPVGGEDYRIKVCSLRDAGSGVSLILRLAAPNGDTVVADKFFDSVGGVPSDNEVTKIARAAAVQHANRQQIARDHVNTVKAVLGL